MILSKLKVVSGLALAGLLTVGVGGVAAYQAGSGQEPKAEKVEKSADEKPEGGHREAEEQARPGQGRGPDV